MIGELLLSFGAGVVGFLSPCVLPLLPAYVGYMTGAGADEPVPLRRALPGTLAFVGGLNVVFVSLFAGASTVSGLLRDNKVLLERVSGAFLILLGALMLLQYRIPWLLRERRFHVRPGGNLGRKFLVGAAFAFGWTPCIGFTLGAAINLAATAETLNRGVALLAAYSIGLSVPFIAAGLGLVKAGAKLKRHASTIQVVAGLVMAVAGVLILTGRLTLITIWMQRGLEELGLDFWNF